MFFIMLIACVLQFFCGTRSVHAQPDDEKRFLLMYFTEKELLVESPTRSPKPLSQVAENVTVITAEEIKLMNAHTVADVLIGVTGLQVLISGGPGSISQTAIQGSENLRHVSVFMDGIPLNNLTSNVTELGSLPVQNIEKIEIIKGPASSAWGSALGGVINIITKTGSGDRVGGTVSASYGERNSGDFRAETSGKQDRLGYYISAGRLQTDGFRSHNDFSGKNAYAKLTYDITRKTSALFTLGYGALSRGVVEIHDPVDPAQDFFIQNKLETLTSTLSINTSFSKETVLNVSVWRLHQISNMLSKQSSSGAGLSNSRDDDDGYGSSAKLSWKQQQHTVVLGTDYEGKMLEANALAGGEYGQRKLAFFINDTMSFEKISITPGIRQDHANRSGDFTSPSLGMTYKIAETTLLRAYAARGFSHPPLGATFGDNLFHVSNPGLKMEQVWSYQLGAETAALQYVWLKLSAFRNDVRDIIVNEIDSLAGTFKQVNKGKARKQGMEIEMKTAPVFHTALSAGAAFVSTRDLDTGETIPNIPQRTYDLGLQYDDEKSFKALLKAHYIYWNSDPSAGGKYNSFIVDLHIIRNIYSRYEQMLEAFADVHNIFNASQYPLAEFKNPGRWLEAGIRYRF